jgi:DNA-binding transcriptional LysR family regulator
MDRLAAFRAFARACETGNFSAVARELGVSQPTISKHIAAAEAQLGVQLFSRTTRRLQPTADGVRLYPAVRQLLDALEVVEAGGRKPADTPSGLLRVAVPESFGRAEIVPRLGRYLARNPKVRIELRMTDATVDLVEKGAELGIRIGALVQTTLVARRIGTVRHRVAAGRGYLAARRAPLVPEELAGHDCIVYTGFARPAQWAFDSEFGRHLVDVSPRLAVDSADALAEAVRADLGIALVPAWLLGPDIEQGRVAVLLDDYYPPSLPIHIVYPETRWLSLRARSFIDFLTEEFGGRAAKGAETTAGALAAQALDGDGT